MAKSKTTAEARADRSRWTIKVTQGDIDRAHVNDSYRCAVATALARQISDATRIEVDLQTVRFTRGDDRLVFLTPYAVCGYIVAFDAGDEIEPFGFTLHDPMKSRRLTTTAEGRVMQKKRNRVQAVKTRAKRAEATLAKPADERTAKQTQRAEEVLAQAPQEIAEADRDLAETRAAYQAAGVLQKTTTTSGRTWPKVSKTRSRAYGMRVLRVNQAEGRTHSASTS